MRSRLVACIVFLGTSIAAVGCTGADAVNLFPGDPSADRGASDGGVDGTSNGASSSDAGGCAMTCASPPPNVCLDAKALRTYAPNGSCASGACAYTPYDVVCTTACQGGACVGDDACNGVTCAAPPASTCVNGSTLKTYGSGTCSAGACSYASATTTCANGCAGGACIGDLCAGVTCNQPPAATCVDATTRRGYGPGNCGGGACTYSPVDTACAIGCLAGACVGDPCAGVTCSQPPAALCSDATTRRSYAASGTCSGGACSYVASDAACPAPANGDPLCTSGTCDFVCRTGFVRTGFGCVSDADAGGSGGVCVVTAANSANYANEYLIAFTGADPVTCSPGGTTCMSLPNSCCYTGTEATFGPVCVPQL